MSKIRIKSTIFGDETEKEIVEVFGIKNNHKVMYIYNDTKVSIELSSNTIIIIRENDESRLILKFRDNDSITSDYYIKSLNIIVKVKTKTKLLKINKNSLKIKYDLFIADCFSDSFTYNLEWESLK